MHSEYLKFIKQAFVLSSGAMAGILTDRYMGVIHEYGSVLGCLILLEAKGEAYPEIFMPQLLQGSSYECAA